MTDQFRAMCAELIDALDSGIPAGRIRMSPLANRARALLAQPVAEGPTLQWTENMPASESCRYDHCIAETPFGRFLITWKSWKKYDSPTVDETPWGDWYGAFNSVGEAKTACQQGFDQRLARWGHPTPQLEGGDIHYAWELHDAEGEWQAGGSAITLESVRREGSYYLQTYSHDGPHTLIIQRVSTIEEVTND